MSEPTAPTLEKWQSIITDPKFQALDVNDRAQVVNTFYSDMLRFTAFKQETKPEERAYVLQAMQEDANVDDKFRDIMFDESESTLMPGDTEEVRTICTNNYKIRGYSCVWI